MRARPVWGGLYQQQRLFAWWNQDWPIAELANQPRHLTNASLEALNQMADHCRERAVISVLGHEPTVASCLAAAGLE